MVRDYFAGATLHLLLELLHLSSILLDVRRDLVIHFVLASLDSSLNPVLKSVHFLLYELSNLLLRNLALLYALLRKLRATGMIVLGGQTLGRTLI